MSDTGSRDFLQIDWSRLPVPVDDGAARHLPGLGMPEVTLPATDGSDISLASLPGGRWYAYPLTGHPGAPLPEGWYEIPGHAVHPAKLRVPRSLCRASGCRRRPRVWPFDPGSKLSTRGRRAAAPPLSPSFQMRPSPDTGAETSLILVDGATLLKRMALIIDDGVITTCFLPCVPPDRNAPRCSHG